MSEDEKEKQLSLSQTDPLSLIRKLAEEQARVLANPFVAPVVPGCAVSVSVSGIAHKLSVDDPVHTGWSILKNTTPRVATVIGAASLKQITHYLSFLPRFRLVLLDEFDGRLWALQANTSDTRASIAGPVVVHLADKVSKFETICARFDGTYFWFECVDRNRDPRVARNLREALQSDVAPDLVRVPNAIPQERFAYKMLWLRSHPELGGQISSTPVTDGERIERALNHAGASLNSYQLTDGNLVRVSYTVDGKQHVSTIRTADLSVVSSGICLSGLDEMFDLTSLVGVMRSAGYDEYY